MGRAVHRRRDARRTARNQGFHLPEDHYAELLKFQGGRCAICGNKPRTRKLARDHNHKTGAVRGLLCGRCNRNLLGAAHDDVKILQAAVAYLTSPPYPRLVRQMAGEDEY